MATKKRSALGALSRSVASRKRKRAARRNPSDGGSAPARDNPPFWEDAVDLVLPGIVSYAGGRITGRIAYNLASKKSAGWGKHLGAISPTLWFVATWFAAHKIEGLKKYHNGIVIGGAVAATQAILQTYMPQWGWILNDYHLDHVKAVKGANGAGANGSSPAAVGGADAYAELGDRSVNDDDDLSDLMGDDDFSEFYQGSFSR